MISKLRKTHKNVILVDAGDMFLKTKTIPEVRAEYVLNGMERMAYDAVTFGEGELNMDFDFLMGALENINIPFVSSNMQIATNQKKQIILPYIIKEIEGLKVAITGITPKVMMDDHVLKNQNIKIDKTITSLKNTIEQLKEKADFILLLSHYGMGGTTNFLRYNDFSDISLSIVGHGRLLTTKVQEVSDTLIVQNSMGGEILSMIKLNLDDSGKIIDFSFENIPLTDEVPEDETLKIKMAEFKMLNTKDKIKEDRINQKKRKEKKELEVLKLTPEAFLKKMQTNEE